MVSTVTNGINCYKWYQLLQLVSTVTNGINCYKWYQLLQLVSTATNGISCCKRYQLLQMVSTVTNCINCYRWYQTLTKKKTGRQGCILLYIPFLITIDWVVRQTTSECSHGIQWTLFSQLEELESMFSSTPYHLHKKIRRSQYEC